VAEALNELGWYHNVQHDFDLSRELFEKAMVRPACGSN
jgi:hypothetical protein